VGARGAARRLVRLVKAQLASVGLAGEALFAGCDPSRLGVIPRARLRAVLSGAGVLVSEAEAASLGDAFRAQRMPEQVSYCRLLAAMAAEDATPDGLAGATVPPSRADSGLAEARDALRAKLSVRRRPARSAFEGVAVDAIPADEFRDRVRGYGLVVPATELQALVRGYRANLRGDVAWRAFCDDIDGAPGAW